jgi:hypothetical protein
MTDKCEECGGAIMWITYPGYGRCTNCNQGYESKVQIIYRKVYE